jgi:hypothetical protein
MQNNMNEYYKYNLKWKNSDKRIHTYDSTHAKFKSRQN